MYSSEIDIEQDVLNIRPLQKITNAQKYTFDSSGGIGEKCLGLVRSHRARGRLGQLHVLSDKFQGALHDVDPASSCTQWVKLEDH